MKEATLVGPDMTRFSVQNMFKHNDKVVYRDDNAVSIEEVENAFTKELEKSRQAGDDKSDDSSDESLQEAEADGAASDSDAGVSVAGTPKATYSVCDVSYAFEPRSIDLAMHEIRL